jgi:hypothetical protein
MLRLIAVFLFVAGIARAASAEAIVPPENMKLFLLIGQSNMAGRGIVEDQDKIPHPRVFVFGKNQQWAPAIDPLHWDKPVAGVGLASTFARVIAEKHPDAVIGLIPAAVGGSSLDQWAIGGEFYNNAVARTKAALVGGQLAGILWHQGESDSAPEKVANYTDRFAKMIAQLRRDLQAPDVPLVVGELGRFRVNHASDAMNAVIDELPQHVPHCACVSSAALHDKGDQLHFDSASLRELGRRYAQAWQDLKSK